jgi:hypothetical protein
VLLVFIVLFIRFIRFMLFILSILFILAVRFILSTLSPFFELKDTTDRIIGARVGVRFHFSGRDYFSVRDCKKTRTMSYDGLRWIDSVLQSK